MMPYDPYPRHPPLPVAHSVHILACLMTAGLWVPVYIAVVINHGRKMRRYRDGQLLRAVAQRKD